MRSWLIYIAAFIGALVVIYGVFLVIFATLLDLGGEPGAFAAMTAIPATAGLLAFAAIYSALHRWRPSLGQLLLGLCVTNGLAILAIVLVFSSTVDAGTAIGVSVLAAFLLGRYLTVRYGNG